MSAKNEDRPTTVKFMLPVDRDTKNEAAFVAVNGKSYAVPRGIPVTMPYEVYDVLLNSEAQELHTMQVISELSKA